MEMIKPKEVAIVDLDGEERKYIISRFPAVDGQRIITEWIGALPSRDGSKSTDAGKEIMKYVAVERGGSELRLSTDALINNHVPDSVSLIKLQALVMDYNTNFSKAVGNSDFFDSLTARLGDILDKLIPMLTDFLERLYPHGLPPTQS
jgi:hypothetical protein